MVNDIGHIFGNIVLFLRGGSQCDEFLVRAQICKNTGGYERIFCKNTSVIRVRIQALIVNYSIFQKGQLEPKIVFSFCSAANSWRGHLMGQAGFLN